LTDALEGFLRFAEVLKSDRDRGNSLVPALGEQPSLPHFNVASHTSPNLPIPMMLSRLSAAAPTLAPYVQALGNTPLIELPAPGNGTRIYGKCEWHNPFGSVKDRTAFALVARLLCEEPELQRSDARILEYSGGNLGISLAHIAKHLGVPASVYLHGKSSPDTVQKIQALQAEVVLVPPGSGFFGVMKQAFERYQSDPTTRLLYQHINDINPAVHEQTTGREIVDELLAKLSPSSCVHWVASVGTGGTLAGVSRALQKAFENVRTYAVSPAELPYGSPEPPNDLPKLAGSGGFGDSYRQPFVHELESEIHGFPSVPYDDAIEAMAVLSRQIGEMVSSSGAAAWLTAFRTARSARPGDVFVVMLPSKATDAERKLASAKSVPTFAHPILDAETAV
jgi:cysteine synthase A